MLQEDYDAWVEAVETSIEYTKQAARAAGMATTRTKKKRRGRASKVNRVQWDNGVLNKKSQLLERGNEHTRIDVEVAQLNQQAVNPSRDGNPLREDFPSKGHSRAASQESREVRPDTKDARKQSKAMMCLETALNEMKLAISNIRTVQIPAAALWHKANLSPPRSYRSLEEHLQSRPDWECRHRQPSLGHNYIDALISPRTPETLASAQHLRRSWDSTSTVDTGAGLPKNHQVIWRSQTTEDLNSLAREDQIPRWRTSKYPTARMSTKLTISQPIARDRQRSTPMDPELHGIISSDEEEHSFQPAGGKVGSSSATVLSSSWKASMNTNGLEPEFAAPLKTITSVALDHPASSNTVQSRSNMIGITHQQSQMVLPDTRLIEQQHASIMPLGSSSKSTPESSTITRMNRVKSFDLAASRASKVTFVPQADATNIADGELNGHHQTGTSMPVSNFTRRGSRDYDVSNRQSALSTNPGLQRTSEKEVTPVAEAQAFADQTILYGGASTSDTLRVSKSQHDFEHPPNLQPQVVNPSEYSPKELYPEKKSMITEAIQPEAAANTWQSQGNFGTQQSNGYSNLGNSYKVVPNSNLQDESSRQYTDILRRLTQDAGPSSAGEPPIFWESPVTSAGLAVPSGVSTPSRRHSQTNLSQGIVRIAETSPGIGMYLNQAGPYPSPSRRHSQTLHNEINREMETSNGHSYESSRRNSLLSSVSAKKVHLDATTDQFAVGQNGTSARNNLSLEQSVLVPNNTQLRNGVVRSDPVVVRNSDVGQAFISGPDLLSSKRQTHTILHQQQSYQQVVSDGSSFQQPPYPNGQGINPESQSAMDRPSMPLPPNPFSVESRVTYADTHTSDTAHTTNGEVMRSQTGVEGFARVRSDPSNANASMRQNEQAQNVSPAVSMTSDHMGASKCSDEAAPSVQVSDITELVNRLVRITAGDELGAKLQGTSSFDRGGALNVDPLPAHGSASQDPLSRTWDRQASLPRVTDEAISSYQPSQTNSYYQPGRDRVLVQTLQTPQMMVPNSNQDNNMTLQLQGFGPLGGNGSSISGPITLKSADGEVIIIGKERRSSTGLLAPQGGEQAQGNLVSNGIQELKAQEERLQDSQQPSRRPSIVGDIGPSNVRCQAYANSHLVG